MQKTIDFSKPITHYENNVESQFDFVKNEPKFRGQCKTIMEAFKRGERLTTKVALLEYSIGDLRRRIKDLKDNYGVDNIGEEKKSGGFKVWFLKKD